MVCIKKFSGNYFLARRNNRRIPAVYSYVFRVRAGSYKSGGFVSMNKGTGISAPEELVGKKIRFKVEVV